MSPRNATPDGAEVGTTVVKSTPSVASPPPRKRRRRRLPRRERLAQADRDRAPPAVLGNARRRRRHRHPDVPVRHRHRRLRRASRAVVRPRLHGGDHLARSLVHVVAGRRHGERRAPGAPPGGRNGDGPRAFVPRRHEVRAPLRHLDGHRQVRGRRLRRGQREGRARALRHRAARRADADRRIVVQNGERHVAPRRGDLDIQGRGAAGPAPQLRHHGLVGLLGAVAVDAHPKVVPVARLAAHRHLEALAAVDRKLPATAVAKTPVVRRPPAVRRGRRGARAKIDLVAVRNRRTHLDAKRPVLPPGIALAEGIGRFPVRDGDRVDPVPIVVLDDVLGRAGGRGDVHAKGRVRPLAKRELDGLVTLGHRVAEDRERHGLTRAVRPAEIDGMAGRTVALAGRPGHGVVLADTLLGTAGPAQVDAERVRKRPVEAHRRLPVGRSRIPFRRRRVNRDGHHVRPVVVIANRKGAGTMTLPDYKASIRSPSIGEIPERGLDCLVGLLDDISQYSDGVIKSTKGDHVPREAATLQCNSAAARVQLVVRTERGRTRKAYVDSAAGGRREPPIDLKTIIPATRISLGCSRGRNEEQHTGSEFLTAGSIRREAAQERQAEQRRTKGAEYRPDAGGERAGAGDEPPEAAERAVARPRRAARMSARPPPARRGRDRTGGRGGAPAAARRSAPPGGGGRFRRGG